MYCIQGSSPLRRRFKSSSIIIINCNRAIGCILDPSPGVYVVPVGGDSVNELRSATPAEASHLYHPSERQFFRIRNEPINTKIKASRRASSVG